MFSLITSSRTSITRYWTPERRGLELNEKQRKCKKTKVRKYETTKVWNNEIAKLRDVGIAKVRNNETAKVRDNESEKLQKCEKAKQRKYETTRLRNNNKIFLVKRGPSCSPVLNNGHIVHWRTYTCIVFAHILNGWNTAFYFLSKVWNSIAVVIWDTDVCGCVKDLAKWWRPKLFPVGRAYAGLTFSRWIDRGRNGQVTGGRPHLTPKIQRISSVVYLYLTLDWRWSGILLASAFTRG